MERRRDACSLHSFEFCEDSLHQHHGCEECSRGTPGCTSAFCRACGHVGCCDDSKNKHASKHFKKTGHPIMTSLEPGESWSWCFVDELGMELG